MSLHPLFDLATGETFISAFTRESVMSTIVILWLHEAPRSFYSLNYYLCYLSLESILGDFLSKCKSEITGSTLMKKIKWNSFKVQIFQWISKMHSKLKQKKKVKKKSPKRSPVLGVLSLEMFKSEISGPPNENIKCS